MRVFVHLHRIELSRGCLRVCVSNVCARRGTVRFPSRGTAATCSINSSAHAGASAAARVEVCVRCHRPGSRVSAAGVNWTCRTASAPWAARYGHTSVIDAAGAIYVIGGTGSTTFQDVWASTDGGARAGLGRGGWSGGTRGGTLGVLRGTRGH